MQATNNRVRVHIVVSGRVQGIGYRWFVQETGERYRLIGWVRNVQNGDVELEAEGEQENVDLFRETLKSGHPAAVVRSMTVDRVPVRDQESSVFEIRF